MSLPAIGVVIPCYKAEHTLRQTVESVLQGAPDNLQLVLVEDGSPDGTGALCDDLAAQDPRVTALHQPNGGASAARNAGLDTLCRSGAEWVLFVDADDTIQPYATEMLVARAEESGADLVIAHYNRITPPRPRLTCMPAVSMRRRKSAKSLGRSVRAASMAMRICSFCESF